MKSVLQVGDIVNVATDLGNALGAHTDWTSVAAPVAEVVRRSKLARVADLPRRALRTRAGIAAAVEATKPDVVHLHWARYAPFINTHGVPFVVHAHGSDVRRRASHIAGRFVMRALSKADAVLVSTPDLLADSPAGARYLPNPVDVDVFAPEPTDVAGEAGREVEPNAQPVVLLFARLIPVKGADRLVAIASALRGIDPSVRVLAVAGGELDGEAAAAGVEMVPKRRRADLVELICSADVVVGQQLLGILSLSELESMACERPVVMPFRHELYDGDVPIVDASEPRAVAEACLELIGDPVRRRTIGAAARCYVAEHHGPAVIGPTLATVYESIV